MDLALLVYGISLLESLSNLLVFLVFAASIVSGVSIVRSEEHTSELQSH